MVYATPTFEFAEDACPYCGDPYCLATTERNCPDWQYEKSTRDGEEDEPGFSEEGFPGDI